MPKTPERAMRAKDPAPLPLTAVEDERGPEVITKAIEDVAGAAKRLLYGPLTRRAVVVLIHDSVKGTKPSLSTIEAVLEAAAGLRKYVTAGPKKP